MDQRKALIALTLTEACAVLASLKFSQLLASPEQFALTPFIARWEEWMRNHFQVPKQE